MSLGLGGIGEVLLSHVWKSQTHPKQGPAARHSPERALNGAGVPQPHVPLPSWAAVWELLARGALPLSTHGHRARLWVRTQKYLLP